MTEAANIREIVLNMLLEMEKNGAYSHHMLNQSLAKYQYLEKKERSFLTRLFEGTVEYRIQLDYILDQFSRVKAKKMKPVIRDILRMAVYQIRFMDSVPNSAACNEAVKLAVRKGFSDLKGFVNGVLRNIAREENKIVWPDREKEPIRFLSVSYSMPEWIVQTFTEEYGLKKTERMLAAFLEEKGTTVRVNTNLVSVKEAKDSLRKESVTVKEAEYVKEALVISGYDRLNSLEAFKRGWIQVQDESSMIAGLAAAPLGGEYIIDVCAAPGGKSLHLASLLKDGFVDARDLTEYKVSLIRENIERSGFQNIEAKCQDAMVYDEKSFEKADILIADLPCSGLGVLGRKNDIKYHCSREKQRELVKLQRNILEVVLKYIKPGGVLIYSTCTICPEENEENVKWITSHFPFSLESIEPYLPKTLCEETARRGYLQLLPGIHKTDGFFIARLKKETEG
jgi:16S rRNA (cytosine967-C5)-methyltransferase